MEPPGSNASREEATASAVLRLSTSGLTADPCQGLSRPALRSGRRLRCIDFYEIPRRPGTAAAAARALARSLFGELETYRQQRGAARKAFPQSLPQTRHVAGEPRIASPRCFPTNLTTRASRSGHKNARNVAMRHSKTPSRPQKRRKCGQ